MRRIGLAVVLASNLLAPVVTEAQPAGKVWPIGILQTSAPKDEAGLVAALEQGSAKLVVAGHDPQVADRFKPVEPGIKIA
jgi:hypothetical protein